MCGLEDAGDSSRGAHRHAGVAGTEDNPLTVVEIGRDGGKGTIELFQRAAGELLIDEVLQGFALEQPPAGQRPVGKDFFVELLGDFLQGIGIVPAGIERADYGTGTGAHDDVRLDAVRFEHLDNANVCEATRGTTPEGETDLGFDWRGGS